MHFQKEHLEGTHYNWSTGSQKNKFMGQPSRRSFDRFDGDQVLFLINFYGSVADRFSIAEGKKIEYAIYHHLPLDAKSEVSVFNWIRNDCLAEQETPVNKS